MTRRAAIDEEQALLRLQLGDAAAARTLLDKLVTARTEAQDELGRHTATLARGRVMLAQGEHEAAAPNFNPPSLTFTSTIFTTTRQARSRSPPASLLRAMNRDDGAPAPRARSAARYDYEYWLARESRVSLQMFSSPDVRNCCRPTCANNPPAASAQERKPPRLHTGSPGAVANRPYHDLIINILAPCEIFRDPARPFAADA